MGCINVTTTRIIPAANRSTAQAGSVQMEREGNKVSWRDDPVTEKQLEMIKNMHEFSDWPLPKFTGKTKGEAADYIDTWIAKANSSILDCWDVTQGIP